MSESTGSWLKGNAVRNDMATIISEKVKYDIYNTLYDIVGNGIVLNGIYKRLNMNNFSIESIVDEFRKIGYYIKLSVDKIKD